MPASRLTSSHRLNEVQFPKKLRPRERQAQVLADAASMKCSSRRNCDKEKMISDLKGKKPQ